MDFGNGSVRFVDQAWSFASEMTPQASSSAISGCAPPPARTFHPFAPRFKTSLRIGRMNAGLPATELARRVCITKDSLVNMERGVEYPSPATLEQLERELNVVLAKNI